MNWRKWWKKFWPDTTIMAALPPAPGWPDNEWEKRVWIERATYDELRLKWDSEDPKGVWRTGRVGQAFLERMDAINPQRPPPRSVDWY